MIEPMPSRLPRIPYDGHPLYCQGRHRIGFADRVLAFARLAQMAAFVLMQQLRQIGRRSPLRAADAGTSDLSRDGVAVSRLATPSRQTILNVARPYFDRLAHSRDRLPPDERTYGDNQLDTHRSEAPELFLAIEEALEASGLLASIRAHLRCCARLRKVTLQINDPRDRYWRAHFDACGIPVPETAFFHIDNTYAVVKLMFYVSEVGQKNGPFSYVPGTHRLRVGFVESVLLRANDIWLDVHPEERCLFPALPRALRMKAKFGDDIPDDSDWSRWLLKNERTFTSVDGDAIVFDAGGIHRGGLVKQGERRVIQAILS